MSHNNPLPNRIFFPRERIKKGVRPILRVIRPECDILSFRHFDFLQYCLRNEHPYHEFGAGIIISLYSAYTHTCKVAYVTHNLATYEIVEIVGIWCE